MLRRLLPLALLLALAACGSEDTAVAPERGASSGAPPLTDRELGWIRGYAVFGEAVYDRKIRGTSRRRACLGLIAKAGPPPTRRLRPAYDTAREACDELGTGGVYRAEQLVDQGFEKLGPLFLTSRALRVAPSPDDASHVDLRLGELASAVSGESIEVRCWSPRDWRRLIIEENAWDAADDDPEVLDGLALTEDGQMHLLLEDCNRLGRLRHQDATELRGEELIEAAYSASILAHEIGHFLEPDADEATVECTVTETLSELADGHWLDEAEVQRLTDAYGAHVRPDLPDEYLKDCR